MNPLRAACRSLSFRLVPELVSRSDMIEARKLLVPLIDRVEEACRAKGLKTGEAVWLVSGQSESAFPFFTEFTFSNEHKLKASSCLTDKLSAFDELEGLSEVDWQRAVAKVLPVALERFAYELKLTGTQDLRIQVKSLIHEQAEPMPQAGEIALSLSWHYDYWAATTLVLPLLNRFPNASGEALLFAENAYHQNVLDGKQGPNHRLAAPKPGSIASAAYPKRGGLLFDGKRGAQIHCPAAQSLPAGVSGIFSRTLIQIVRLDEGWKSLG